MFLCHLFLPIHGKFRVSCPGYGHRRQGSWGHSNQRVWERRLCGGIRWGTGQHHNGQAAGTAVRERREGWLLHVLLQPQEQAILVSCVLLISQVYCCHLSVFRSFCDYYWWLIVLCTGWLGIKHQFTYFLIVLLFILYNLFIPCFTPCGKFRWLCPGKTVAADEYPHVGKYFHCRKNYIIFGGEKWNYIHFQAALKWKEMRLPLTHSWLPKSALPAVNQPLLCSWPRNCWPLQALPWVTLS